MLFKKERKITSIGQKELLWITKQGETALRGSYTKTRQRRSVAMYVAASVMYVAASVIAFLNSHIYQKIF